MEYPQLAWLTFIVSALTAYALAGWIFVESVRKMEEVQTGEGLLTEKGFYSHMLNGKPYNSGDPRAG